MFVTKSFETTKLVCDMKTHATIIGNIRIGLSALWLLSECLVFSIL